MRGSHGSSFALFTAAIAIYPNNTLIIIIVILLLLVYKKNKNYLLDIFAIYLFGQIMFSKPTASFKNKIFIQ